MSECGWTKGPWSVADKGYGWDHFAAIVTPTGIVANCHIAALSRDYTQTAADAHLIAAAPDLYQALAAIMSHHASKVLFGNREMAENAWSALAKARGETQ